MEFTEYTDTDARRLLSRLGSFWHTIFDGQDQLFALWRARVVQAEQLYMDWLEAYSSAVFSDIPVLHRQHWSTLALTESGLTRAPIRYGESGVDYGGGYRYGRSSSQALYWKLPEDVRDIRFLHDNPLDPAVTLARGVDFTVADGVLTFYRNPFADLRFAPVDLYEEHKKTDRGLVLWCEHAEIDRQHLLTHLGAALKLYLPSTESAKRAMTALANLYAAFPSRASLTTFLAALVDAPAVREESEVVEAVLTRPRRQVVTDRHVYDVAPGAVVTVKPGDLLLRGDLLTDAVRFSELANRELPAADLPALVCGSSLLLGPYRYELTFPNRVERVWRENGRHRFTVLGDAEDVVAFWAGVDARGGLSLTGRTVNPAQALLSCLRGHGVFVRLNAASFGPEARPALVLEFLRRALAPRLVMLSYMEFAVPGEEIRLTQPLDDVRLVRIVEISEEAPLHSADAVGAAAVADC